MTHSAQGVNYILKETFLPAILHQLHDTTPFWSAFNTSFTVDSNDWGFDNIFPAPPKAVEQVWFRDWERRVAFKH